MIGRVLLLRHPPVAPEWAGVCYGAADAPLAPDWDVPPLAGDVVYYSGLARTRLPAVTLAARLGVPCVEDARLRERHFGAWEGRTWDSIFAETGDAMMGMVREPATWAPPGGETTFALRDRVLEWFDALPTGATVIAVAHGGPIAALLGTLRGLSADWWPGLVPKCGDFREVSHARPHESPYRTTDRPGPSS